MLNSQDVNRGVWGSGSDCATEPARHPPRAPRPALLCVHCMYVRDAMHLQRILLRAHCIAFVKITFHDVMCFFMGNRV